jgi:hypothetical protein
MSDSRFSGGQPSGDDRFGYFGAAARPSTGAPAQSGSNQFGGSSQFGGASQFGGSSQFGGAPAAPGAGAPNPFGTAPGPQAPFGTGAPMYGPPPTTSRGSSKAKPIVIAVVVLAVLGVGWFGYHVYLRSRPVQLPATVAGLPVTTEPTVLQAVDQAQQQLQGENPGMQLQVKAYGTADTHIVIAAAGRGRTNVDRDFAAFGNDIGGTSQVGASTCAQSPASHVAVCERTNGDLTVMVADVARAAAPREADVAAMVDEIWARL